MNKELKKKLVEHIPNNKFAIATSGGIDSMSLCHLCNSLNKNFIAIIVDHKYRRNSSEEAESVKQELALHNIESVILKNDNSIPKANIEKNLRDIRYNLITDYCKSNGINTVFTAHHQDDNIETFLMRLERGSSIDGLTGIKKESSFNGIKFIRPLLSFTKSELTKFLVQNNLKWFEDESNEDTKFTRNNIRKTLQNISDYNTFSKRISGVMASFERVSDYLNQQLDKSFEDICTFKDKIYHIDRIKYKNLHDEISLRILKKILLNFIENKNKFRFEKIRHINSKIKSSDNFKQTLGSANIIGENDIITIKEI